MMGTWHGYRCKGCEYSPQVSGGADVGFCIKTQTGFCRVCEELVDYVTAVHERGEELEDKIIIGGCPDCNTQIEQDWNDGDSCPKCGGDFEKSGLICDWD